MNSHKFLLIPALLFTTTLLSMQVHVMKEDDLKKSVMQGDFGDSFSDEESSDEAIVTPVSRMPQASVAFQASPDAPTTQMTTEERIKNLLRGKKNVRTGTVAQEDAAELDNSQKKVVGHIFRLLRLQHSEDSIISEINKLVEQGFDPDFLDETGRTLLHHAVSRGKSKIIEYLLDILCVDPRRTFEGKTYLDIAIEKNQIDSVLSLKRHIPLHIANGVGEGELPFVKAVALERQEIIDLLLLPDVNFANFGQPKDRVGAYQHAIIAGDKQLAQQLKVVSVQTAKLREERLEKSVLEQKHKTRAFHTHAIQQKIDEEVEKNELNETPRSSFVTLPRLLGLTGLGIIGFIAYKVGQESRLEAYSHDMFWVGFTSK